MLEKPWVTVSWQERGKMLFQPNVVILKGRAIDRSLPQTMVHIFSQWGSLMCEQGSGRAVNRPFYESLRGELGCQWRGLSHVCHVSTLGPGLFVLMAARDWRDCGPCLHWICVKQESSHSMRNWPLRLHQSHRCNPFPVKSSGVAPIYCSEIISPDTLIIPVMHSQDGGVIHKRGSQKQGFLWNACLDSQSVWELLVHEFETQTKDIKHKSHQLTIMKTEL